MTGHSYTEFKGAKFKEYSIERSVSRKGAAVCLRLQV